MFEGTGVLLRSKVGMVGLFAFALYVNLALLVLKSLIFSATLILASSTSR